MENFKEIISYGAPARTVGGRIFVGQNRIKYIIYAETRMIFWV